MGFSKKHMNRMQEILRYQGKKITVAESCTGGLIASKITAISGSSDVFDGSIVSYSNLIKEKELGVNEQVLKSFGAVSKQVVSQMLDGVIQKFDADYAIAVSGIAGPGGGSEQKPVGTVVIGIASKNDQKLIKQYKFDGDRITVQKKATKKALKKLYKLIKST